MIADESRKILTVRTKNTFYFFNSTFETEYEGRHIGLLRETLLVLKNRVERTGAEPKIFENFLWTKGKTGLTALLTLTGLSNENLKRLITIIRITDDPELSQLVFKDKWAESVNLETMTEWSDSKILQLIHQNRYFRMGIVNLFFEGASVPFLAQTLPLFELNKLSVSKLRFDIPALIDTLVRYKEKGSYSAKSPKNAESAITEALEELQINSDSGDLPKLERHAPNEKRTMDFIIPNRHNPKVVIESSFVSTTSSGLGDKARAEIGVRDLLTTYYPEALFIGFVDGIGWYVRQRDLERMVSAFRDVFTFEESEIERFRTFLKQVL